MMPRYTLLLLLLLFAGCGGGGSSTSSPPPAAVRLAVTGVGTNSGNDVVTVTATVTDAAGHPVSGKVDVRVTRPQSAPPSTALITGTSDGTGQLSLPVTVGPYEQATITAVAGTVTSNALAVTPAGGMAAVPLVAVVPSPDGRYAVDCFHFDGVAAMDVIILYNSAAASGPIVERGGYTPGAVMVSNTETPGTLRIASILPYPRTFSGEGTFATFRFDTEIPAPAGTISSLQVQLLDVRGEPVPARTLLINSYE